MKNIIGLFIIVSLASNCTVLSAQDVMLTGDHSNKNFISINGYVFMPDTVFTIAAQNRLSEKLVFELNGSTKSKFKEIFRQLQEIVQQHQPVIIIYRKTDYNGVQLSGKKYRNALFKEMLFSKLMSGQDSILTIKGTAETQTLSITSSNEVLTYSDPSVEKFTYLHSPAYSMNLGNLPVTSITFIHGLAVSNDENKIVTIGVEGSDIAAWNAWYTTGIKNEMNGSIKILTPDKASMVIDVKLTGVSAASFQIINKPGGGSLAIVGLKCKKVIVTIN